VANAYDIEASLRAIVLADASPAAAEWVVTGPLAHPRCSQRIRYSLAGDW